VKKKRKEKKKISQKRQARVLFETRCCDWPGKEKKNFPAKKIKQKNKNKKKHSDLNC